jgi:thioesterase superfamily protein/tubulysin polyketide synthase-like protein
VSIAEFLSELRRRDVEVAIDGDELRCSARAGALTPELRDRLKERKTDILDFLRQAKTLAAQARAIVPLQSRGTGVPVFAVPGHNGDVFCYRLFARHFPEAPFFGLQPPGLDGRDRPLTRLEDFAGYFAAQIRAAHPGGPVIIAGFCAGGVVAFELARQLESAGTPVRFLALFGSPYPTFFRPLRRMWNGLGAHARKLVGWLARLPCREGARAQAPARRPSPRPAGRGRARDHRGGARLHAGPFPRSPVPVPADERVGPHPLRGAALAARRANLRGISRP